MIKISELALKYEPFKDGQDKIISDLVWRVFSEFEVPDYSEEGVNTFKEIIVPERIAEKIKNEGFKVYCCFNESILVGVLGVRDKTHISLLFVDKRYHRKGIAKELLRLVIVDIQKFNPELREITVNSSPYAVKIYEKLGFMAIDNMQEKDGIKYTPMKKSLM